MNEITDGLSGELKGVVSLYSNCCKYLSTHGFNYFRTVLFCNHLRTMIVGTLVPWWNIP